MTDSLLDQLLTAEAHESPSWKPTAIGDMILGKVVYCGEKDTVHGIRLLLKIAASKVIQEGEELDPGGTHFGKKRTSERSSRKSAFVLVTTLDFGLYGKTTQNKAVRKRYFPQLSSVRKILVNIRFPLGRRLRNNQRRKIVYPKPTTSRMTSLSKWTNGYVMP